MTALFSHDYEKNGIQYTLHGDRYFPDLLSEDVNQQIPGKYGMMHAEYSSLLALGGKDRNGSYTLKHALTMAESFSYRKVSPDFLLVCSFSTADYWFFLFLCRLLWNGIAAHSDKLLLFSFSVFGNVISVFSQRTERVSRLMDRDISEHKVEIPYRLQKPVDFG